MYVPLLAFRFRIAVNEIYRYNTRIFVVRNNAQHGILMGCALLRNHNFAHVAQQCAINQENCAIVAQQKRNVVRVYRKWYSISTNIVKTNAKRITNHEIVHETTEIAPQTQARHCIGLCGLFDVAHYYDRLA